MVSAEIVTNPPIELECCALPQLLVRYSTHACESETWRDYIGLRSDAENQNFLHYKDTFEEFLLAQYTDTNPTTIYALGKEVSIHSCFRLLLFPVSSSEDAETLFWSACNSFGNAAIRSTLLLGEPGKQVAIGEAEASLRMRQYFQTPQRVTCNHGERRLAAIAWVSANEWIWPWRLPSTVVAAWEAAEQVPDGGAGARVKRAEERGRFLETPMQFLFWVVEVSR